MDKAYYPDLARKLAEIKATGDMVAYNKALEKLAQVKGFAYADDMNRLVSGSAEKMGETMKSISGDEFKNKIAQKLALKKLGSKALKSIPLFGSLAGLGAAAASGDVAAALPIFGDSEDAGPQKGSPEDMLESGKINRQQLDEMQNRAKASDLSSLIDYAKQFKGEQPEDETMENSYNRKNAMKQVQPMDEDQLQKFNKLKSFLGK